MAEARLKFIGSLAFTLSMMLLVAAPCRAQEVESTIALAETGDQQSAKAPDVPPTPRHTGIKAMIKNFGSDVKQLPSKENLYWSLSLGALALGVHPGDSYVERHMLGNRLASDIFRPGAIVGNVVPWAGSITTYAWGRIKDQPKVSHVGMDLIQSQAMATGITMALKYSTRRERPDHSNKLSFPSGHSSSTFAFATALERHLGWRWVVPAYAGAAYVAASRLPANRHWLSDVVFGAAVGIISGRTVTHFEDDHPFKITVSPTDGGAVVMFAPARFNR
jgi:membrane-associated phospholipid phosphatase